MSETTADALFPEGDLEGERGCGPAMRELVRWWELRRLAYDVVLLLVGLPLTWALVRFAGEKAAPGEILLAGATFFAVANACYFLGPLAELYADVAQKIPVRRMGTPEDVAKATAFLISDDAGYINGVILPVEGGTLGLPPW